MADPNPAHVIADLDAARTKAVRVLTADAQMLTDALHALRNGAPGVVEEYLDRVLTNMTALAEDLRTHHNT